jgi:hypothetical protein
MKRALRFVRPDGTFQEIELSKATVIHKIKKQMIHLDQLADKTYRIIWTDDFEPFDEFDRIEIIRE